MNRLNVLVLGGLLLLLSLSRAAIAAEYALPLELAIEATRAAIAQCEAGGYRVTAAVVDSAGDTRVLLKGDDSTPHTRDTAFRKAYTVITMAPVFGFDTTGQWAARLQNNPNAAALASIPNILPLAGGVAIRVHGKVVGAIGVGGAPGGEKDEVCAAAGLAQIRSRLPG